MYSRFVSRYGAVLLLISDVVLLSAALISYFLLRFGHLRYLWAQLSSPPFVALGLSFVFSYYMFDLYSLKKQADRTKYMLRFMVATTLAAIMSLVIFFFVLSVKISRIEFVTVVTLMFLYSYLWRLAVAFALGNRLLGDQNIVIAGAGWAGKALYAEIKDLPGMNVVGFVDDNPEKWGARSSPVVLGGCELLEQMVDSGKVNTIVIAITHLKGQDLLKTVLRCKTMGARIYDMPTFYKEVTGKLPVEHLDDFWLVNTEMLGLLKSVYNQRIKRFCDILFSCIGLVLSSPLIALAAIAIKAEDRGPIFFRQVRAGLNGKPFEIIKMRSMRTDAEKDGAKWASQNDSRITFVGNIIRKLRIDEIPQMWNVLRGDMSFIGPRPERPEFVEMLARKIPYFSLRHSVKPGITGWAQVNYGYGASERDSLEKLQYDLFYIKNLTIMLEAQILLMTVRVVLFGRGR